MKRLFLFLLFITAFSAHAMEEEIGKFSLPTPEEAEENSKVLQSIKENAQFVTSGSLTEVSFEYEKLQVKIIEKAFLSNYEMHYHDPLIFFHDNKEAILLEDLPTIQKRKKLVRFIGLTILTQLFSNRRHRTLEELPIKTMTRHTKPLFGEQ